jgi:ribosomal protein S21
MIQVRKRQGERAELLLRRFNRAVQESGLLRIVKETKFYTKPPSKRERREEAKRKMMIKKLKRYY